MTARWCAAWAITLLAAACSGSSDTTGRHDGAQPNLSPLRTQTAPGPTPAEREARQAASTAMDDAPYFTKLPLKEFMPHVMQYAGDGIWKRQGSIHDRSGEHSLFPKNDAEWEDAESASRTLAEITNVLLIPGRRVPDRAWDAAVLGVRKVALEAAIAAEHHDEAAFFKAGGDLDEACDACHVRFDPSFRHQPA